MKKLLVCMLMLIGLSLPVMAEDVNSWCLKFEPQIACYALAGYGQTSLDVTLLGVNDFNFGLGFNEGWSVFIDKNFISNTTIGIFINSRTSPMIGFKIGAYL